MPDLTAIAGRQWAQLRASASISNYVLLEALHSGAKKRSDLPDGSDVALPDAVTSGWVAETKSGSLCLTEAGLRHLRSF